MGVESAGGLLLFAAAIAAVIAANSPWADEYDRLRAAPLSLGVAPLQLTKSFAHWVNDGLMALFFLLVGLEIKRETMRGELRAPSQAMLPVAAALGGAAVPALLYLAVIGAGPGREGWAIPMATDIAFALGVLALLGARAAPSLRVFVTALAIVDDLLAVLVIALFYSGALSGTALAIGVVLLLGLLALNRAGVTRLSPYLLLGVALWLAILKSGIHATVAGVLLAITIPLAAPAETGGEAPLERLEASLHPWVAFLIMPVFAFTNAGERLAGFPGGLGQPVTLGIIVGLVLGKPLGVLIASAVVTRLGGALPDGAGWGGILGAGTLAGIGFTMALFIAGLAFEGTALLPAARVGILTGSLISLVVGSLILLAPSRRPVPGRG